MMYPFAVLVILALGAVVADAAVLFQAHREAVDTASGLAADVASLVDEEVFATEQRVELDEERVAAALAYTNDVVLADHPAALRCTVTIGESEVTATCAGRGRALLLPISGRSGVLAIEATASARTLER